LLTKKLGLSDLCGRRALLTVGRLVERKGHDKVLEALDFLRDKYSDLIYFVVGGGAFVERLRGMVRALELEDRVFFFENVRNEELALFYEAAELFVMPSRELNDGDVEGFGIVYLEANLFSLPIIGGRSGGVPEAVVHGETGLLVDGENVGEIVMAVSRLLDNRQFADMLGQKGLRRARDEFRWEKQASKLIEIIK
jgi:phosphatidylinositol alpha-1,6-mannosyltransferase